MSQLIFEQLTSNPACCASIRVWMPRTILVDTCFSEASEMFPWETGGTFMGWWTDPNTAVVTAAIGPGPNAIHGEHFFQPDQKWQLEQIADHYQNSGRRETYLGDWHSHPNASCGALSWMDKRVLRRVIGAKAARCPTPLMSIFWGNPDNWNVASWRGRKIRRGLIWNPLLVELVAMNVYEPK